MQRSVSPSGLLWQETAGPKPPPAAGHKAAYRLFPFSQPTPPASPASLQRATLAKAADSCRRRSLSLDDTARNSTAHHYALRQSQIAAKLARKASISDVKPMSTVQELPLDSPTVPSRYTPRCIATDPSDENGHGRSISAPSECVQDIQVYPPLSLRTEHGDGAKTPAGWSSEQAATSTRTLHGLGLTLPTNSERARPIATKAPKQKPNLRLHIRKHKEEPPPPPPPKSPRHHSRNVSMHSRTSSVQSRTSIRGGSPIAVAQTIACASVKPIFVNHGAHTVPDRTPPTIPETQASYFGRSADTRVQDVMGSPGTERARPKKAVSRKPVPLLPVDAGSDKPAPILLLPSSKFSYASPTTDLYTEAERTPKALPPQPGMSRKASAEIKTTTLTIDSKAQSIEGTDAPPPTPRKNSVRTKKKSNEPTLEHSRTPSDELALPPPTPTKDCHTVPAKRTKMPRLEAPTREPPARSGSPQPPPKSESTADTKRAMRELPSRATTPDPSLRLTMDRPTAGLPFRSATPEPSLKPTTDRPTPELPFRSATPDPSSGQDKAPADPLQTLIDLARQTEALHARYASLRSDRQKLSTSIVCSLKEQKAGPDYCNTLLDQHLSLAAINSSMDICFAKLKSLECRKEEAMTNIIAQKDAQHKVDKANKPNSTRSTDSLRPSESGRSTLEQAAAVVKTQESKSKLRKDSARTDEMSKHAESGSWEESAGTESDTPNTIIRLPQPPWTDEPENMSGTDAEDHPPKKIRVKGAKAAKILGLMTQAVDGRPGSPDITLPDEPERKRTLPLTHGGPTLEVYIPTSPFKLLPPRSPAPTTPLPTPPARKDTEESSASMAPRPDSRSSEAPSRAGSSAESSPEEPEVQTPQEEKEESQLVTKSSKRGLLRSIQVFVDDEILDYYHSAKR